MAFASTRRANISARSSAPDSCFIDIMMNVGIIFYAANRRPAIADLLRIAHRALPDDAALPGARRRQHRPRGHFRPRDRRVLARGDAPGLARRFVVGARTGLGALRIWHRLLAIRGDARFLDTAQRCADFYIERTRRRTGSRRTTGKNRHRGGRTKARPRPSPPAASCISPTLIARPGAGGAIRRLCSNHPRPLLTPEFLAVDTPGWEGILKHGSYHERKTLASMKASCGASTSSSKRWTSCSARRPCPEPNLVDGAVPAMYKPGTCRRSRSETCVLRASPFGPTSRSRPAHGVVHCRTTDVPERRRSNPCTI